MSWAVTLMIAGALLVCAGWERWRAKRSSRAHLGLGLAICVAGAVVRGRVAGFEVGLTTTILVAMAIGCAYAFVSPVVRRVLLSRGNHRVKLIVSDNEERVGRPSRSSAGS